MAHKYVNPKSVAQPMGQYSNCVETASNLKWLHVAGQVGIDKDGKLGADFAAQANNVWINLTNCLKECGYTMDDVVRVNHFLTDGRFAQPYREIRAKYLGNAKPASTLLIVQGLADPTYFIEVELTAAKA